METPQKNPLRGLTLAPVAALLAIGSLATVIHLAAVSAASVEGQASASSTAAGSSVVGVLDGDRFSLNPGCFWQGATGPETWWWQIRFPEPQPVGTILQINGDHPSILSKAPRRYVWQWSEDGQTWQNLPETEIERERRLFRVLRLEKPRRVISLRIMIHDSIGEAPTLREIEIFPEPSAAFDFPDWLIAVSTTTENSRLPGETGSFVDLARKCQGWENVLAQQMWLGDFDEAFVSAEPRPLCAFLSGNFLEWCQQAREPWRGVGEVFADRNLPIWASCGGAQALAILQETGVDKPWDCPRCRDPQHPKSPVYSHIGHTGDAECGDYSKNVAERGKFNMRLIARDPAFQGIPAAFEAMESHIGQIAYLPKGWVRVVTKGPGALTENQCLRVADRYIYAAQFHVEMRGTPENSRRIMANFLRLARTWGGYNPRGKAVPAPEPIADPPD